MADEKSSIRWYLFAGVVICALAGSACYFLWGRVAALGGAGWAGPAAAGAGAGPRRLTSAAADTAASYERLLVTPPPPTAAACSAHRGAGADMAARGAGGRAAERAGRR
jgi:hypothetical protein